jgi:2-keto-3-deoxy-L-rhamnonate aldolase RhmA
LSDVSLLEIGPLVQLPSEEVVEIIGLSGFSFVVLDLEHGGIGLDRLPGLVRAAQSVGATPWARVPGLDGHSVSRVLELGVQTLLFPQLETLEDVRAAIALTRFAPAGTRGVCNGARVAGYGIGRDEGPQPKGFPDIVVTIETNELASNLDETIGIDGVSGVIVGVYDLTAAMGASSPADPRVQDVVRAAARSCHEQGKRFGYYARVPSQIGAAIEHGASFALCGLDVYAVTDTFRGLVAQIREAERESAASPAGAPA